MVRYEPVAWSDVDDAVIAGDLTAVLAYCTPAGGVALTPVAPIGLRDRDAGTVAFTTSNGFGRKLDRIDQNPRIALAYHAREHGFASGPRFVLVQGTATYDREPDPAVLAEKVGPASTRFMGAPKTGVFWDRWLSVYYGDRVLVSVDVDRVTSWPDEACNGESTVVGEPAPEQEPDSQKPPRKGIWPRVDSKRVEARLSRTQHLLLGYVGADGFPTVTPVGIGGVGTSGLKLSGHLPAGKRRAGLLGHRYEHQLIGLEVHQYTGWLQDGVYAPHTENGFRAPSNKTVLLLANGLMARQGRRKARRRERG